MGLLEERWAAAGFVRVHRSFLVATGSIEELRVEPGGGHVVMVAGTALPVSRRHSRELKDRLVRRARRETR
jgi:DNA-binding LytR/AlgR family response regulator